MDTGRFQTHNFSFDRVNQPEKRRHLLPITFRINGETNVCVDFVRKHMRAKHAFTAAKRIPSERACLTSYTKKYSEKIWSRYGKVILQTTQNKEHNYDYQDEPRVYRHTSFT